MPANKINWTLQGKKTSPREIKAELIESFEYELYATAGALVEDLDNLVERLKKRSTGRGQGFLAARYNDVFDELRFDSEVDEDGGVIRIFVPDDTKSGQIFNILDQGAPARFAKGGEPMRFPSYSGTRTKPDKFTLSRSNVKVPDPDPDAPKWVSVMKVEPIEPRRFFDTIVEQRRFKNYSLVGVSFGNVRRKRPKFKWESGTVKVKVVERGE